MIDRCGAHSVRVSGLVEFPVCTSYLSIVCVDHTPHCVPLFTMYLQALEVAVLRERTVLAMELAADLQAKGLLPGCYLQQLGRPPCLADITAALVGQLRLNGHHGGVHGVPRRMVEPLGPPEALLPTHIFE